APEFSRACHEATGGNPFLLRELLGELAQEGISPSAEAAGGLHDFTPASVARTTLVRLSRLPEAAAAIARAIAVIHSAPELRHVSALAGVELGEAGRLVDALVDADVLREGRPLEFRHPLVRTAVYEDMPPAERADAHARAARLLAEDSAEVEVTASHLLYAEPAGDAARVATLRAAAERAAAAGSLETSVRYLERALAEPPPADERAELLAALGEHEVRLLRLEGIEHLLGAVVASSDPRLRGEALLTLAAPLMYTGQTDRAGDLLEEVIPEVAPIDRELALRLELELLTATRMAPTNPRISDERMAELVRLPGDTTAERGILALYSYLSATAEPLQLAAAEATELCERALAGGQLITDATADWHPTYWAVNALMVCDELDRAARFVEQALDDAADRGSMIGFMLATGHRSAICFQRGALAEAETDARTALDVAITSGYPVVITYALAYLVCTLIERGQRDTADDLLTQYGLGGEIPDLGINNLVLQARSLLHAAQGRSSDAKTDGTEMHERGRRLGAAGDLAWRHALVMGLMGTGEHERAREVARRHLERARRFGAKRGLGSALRTAGLAEGGDRGLELLAEAVSVLEHSPGRLERAKALVDYGAALRRGNQRAAARPPLKEALDLALRCGAEPTVERAESELRATGGRPRRQPVKGLDALTASERRIAALAADGMPNREIAQRLFVTLRTVETHLTSAYRKLGISSRGELQDALREE
ncbi:MAG: LuxR C-terminal-related transcriptional regulator, partial [Actinomycetota bacterium]|nr:LuxR C-terminal-related transcriptional regulator [Actinomycetota bacterium]